MSLIVSEIESGYTYRVLHGVSMKSRKGKITCLIGPNGAGKSTLLKTIFGFLKAEKGSIYFEDEEITGLSPHQVMMKGIVYVPQERSAFPELTVLENLRMGAFIINDRDLIKERLKEVYARFPILEERKEQKAGKLSGGEQKMLELGRSLMLDPKLVLLDEPSCGLAPKLVNSVCEKIGKMNREGKTFVIVEQKIQKILSISDYLYVLDLGKNMFDGEPDDLLKDDRLVNLYIGKI